MTIERSEIEQKIEEYQSFGLSDEYINIIENKLNHFAPQDHFSYRLFSNYLDLGKNFGPKSLEKSVDLINNFESINDTDYASDLISISLTFSNDLLNSYKGNRKIFNRVNKFVFKYSDSCEFIEKFHAIYDGLRRLSGFNSNEVINLLERFFNDDVKKASRKIFYDLDFKLSYEISDCMLPFFANSKHITSEHFSGKEKYFIRNYAKMINSLNSQTAVKNLAKMATHFASEKRSIYYCDSFLSLRKDMEKNNVQDYIVNYFESINFEGMYESNIKEYIKIASSINEIYSVDFNDFLTYSCRVRPFTRNDYLRNEVSKIPGRLVSEISKTFNILNYHLIKERIENSLMAKPNIQPDIKFIKLFVNYLESTTELGESPQEKSRCIFSWCQDVKRMVVEGKLDYQEFMRLAQ